MTRSPLASAILEVALPLLLVLALLSAGRAAIAHGDASWIMQDKATEHCCGPEDCRPLEPFEVTRKDGVWLVNGMIVPPYNIFPSKAADGRFWGCFYLNYDSVPPAETGPRCLFVPMMF